MGGADNYRLETHGRYAHAERYVEHVLARQGLFSKVEHAELRLEAGAPVEGLVIRATKPRHVQADFGA
jgi:predicted TPR repeat methyltransferase